MSEPAFTPTPTPAPTDRRDDPSTSHFPVPTTPLAVRFTGSGSEYFRIWIVNLLLSVLTLSLYLPYARARRLQYFYSNTLVDGHALGFHGRPAAMLRGHLLVLAFAVCYGLAGAVSPLAGGVAGLALAVLWPQLWHSALRFRLANSSWRGLRLRFDGTAGQAYQAMLPIALAAALVLAGLALGGDDPKQVSPGASAAIGLGVLFGSLGWPWMLARLRRHQHNHLVFADQTSRLEVGTSRIYSVFIRASLMGVVPVFVLAVVAAIALPALQTRGVGAPPAWLVVPTLMLVYGAMLVTSQAYLSARLQNLLWGHTRSARLRFRSALSARRLGLLMARNLLLTVLTLGLYRPFAVVAVTRLRLEAVQIEVQGDPAQWRTSGASGRSDTSGDAAGDLLGIDIGL